MTDLAPITEDECTEDEWKIFLKAQKARERAATLSSELESMGVTMDLAVARVDHLTLALCRLGIISKMQYGNIILDANSDIASQLQSVRDRRSAEIDRMVAQQREEARRQRAAAAGALSVPPEKKLIIPPGAKT